MCRRRGVAGNGDGDGDATMTGPSAAVPVLTAVTGAAWEADLVSALDRTGYGISVVRRCVDLADLLAAAASGAAMAALLSAELRRLDRDALVRLAAAGVAVVGLVNAGDEDAERRLRQLGVVHVVPADAGAETIAATVLEAVGQLDDPDHATAARRLVSGPFGDPPDGTVAGRDSGDDTGRDSGGDSGDPPPRSPGRLVAVWGPTGAPGRTSVAVGIADEAARQGVDTLLIDADVYGGVIAQVLGLLDESPGLAAAARQSSMGSLDAAGIDSIALRLGPQLRVLTGIARPERWPEIAGSAMEVVLDVARGAAPLTVVDCGFCIEQDEELSYDTIAPRRNGTTLAVLAAADTVVCVGGADPVALQRLVRSLSALREILPDIAPDIVINRIRKGVIPGDPRREIRAALQRYAGVEITAFLPNDPAATDAALAVGKTLGESAPGSQLRAALVDLARTIARIPASSGAGRRKP